MEKQIITSIFLIGLCLNLCAQEHQNPREFEYTEGDTTYVMKQYIFCLYLSGTERSQSDEEAAEIQREHLGHLASLEEKGLQVAGPFGDDGKMRGILLFDLETVDDANALVAKDPAVMQHRLDFECHPLWLAKGTTLK